MDELSQEVSILKIRQSQGVVKHAPASEKVRFFCDETVGVMHRASALELNHKVRKQATELHNTKLPAKLAVGDIRATGADCHTHTVWLDCITGPDRVVIIQEKPVVRSQRWALR